MAWQYYYCSRGRSPTPDGGGGGGGDSHIKVTGVIAVPFRG